MSSIHRDGLLWSILRDSEDGVFFEVCFGAMGNIWQCMPAHHNEDEARNDARLRPISNELGGFSEHVIISFLYFRMRCWQHNSRHTLQGHGSTAVKSLRSFKSQLEIGIPPPCWKINYTYHCYLYVISVTSYFIIVSTFKHLSCTAKVGIELVQDSIILQRLRQ